MKPVLLATDGSPTLVVRGEASDLEVAAERREQVSA
jgi:hypothetical protein